MTVPLSAVREAVERDWRRFRSMLDTGGGAVWSAPTRLPGWTVGDLAAHAVWGVSMEADALRRLRTGAGGRADGRTVADATDRNEVLNALDGACDELAAELEKLTDADLGSAAPLPYGDVPVAMFSQIVVMEAGIHTDDLAASLGREDELPADVVDASQTVLRVFLPILAGSATDAPERGTSVLLQGDTVGLRFRYQDGRWEAPEDDDGSAPDATITGDDAALVLLALGRVPVTDPRVSVAGAGDVGHRLKAWLPGP